MVFRSSGPMAWPLVCVLGGVLMGLPAASAQAEAAAVAGVALPPVAPPELMLAKHWSAALNPGDFLVSEKLDGVRAVWDGRILRFRSGRVMAAPGWFTAALPPTPLDGELWLGRGQFDRLSGIARRATPVDAEWRELRYKVFDLPGAAGTFAARTARATSLVGTSGMPSWLQAVEQTRGTDQVALQQQLRQLVGAGGEGVMLHRTDALWSAGRSDSLFKLKSLPDDEGRVIGHLPGKGRHTGRLGALLLVLPSGQQFALGTGFTDAQRESPPAIGAVVTYRYQERTPAGLPRFASYLRVREAE